MAEKKVLIAFDSPTVRAMLRKELTAAGFSVLEAKDGFEALYKLIKNQPDCALLYVALPVIDVYAFVRIVRNTKSLARMGLIICSIDDTNVYSFWTSRCKSDGYYQIQDSNNAELISLITHTIERYGEREISPVATPSYGDLMKLVTDAFDKELFELYVVRDAYTAETHIYKLDALLNSMADSLYSIYPYDALAIILNDTHIQETYRKIESLDEKEFEDFQQIARTDFQAIISNRADYNWQTANSSISNFASETKENAKIRSYECFPLDRKNNELCTVHIAKCTEAAINIRTRERIDFFISTYTALIKKALLFKQTNESELRIKKAFSRFLPPAIIDNIISEEDSLTARVGEKRRVAVLIADIRDFTTISEKNKPEVIVSFLNDYFAKMGKIINKHGGTIDKFMGDAIMALFGAPESYIYNGNRAANAALEMVEELKNIDTGSLVMGDIDFNIGIGIHYGEPIAGSIGSEEKKEYTVIGDAVNVSSRVEGLTKRYGTRILITETVKKDIDMLEIDTKNGEKPDSEEASLPHLTRHIDNVKVKGKSKAVKIFSIMTDGSAYSESFLDNYAKGLNQYEIGNFNTAIDYFRQAADEKPDDVASRELLNRCTDFLADRPKNWDGAVSLTTK